MFWHSCFPFLFSFALLCECMHCILPAFLGTLRWPLDISVLYEQIAYLSNLLVAVIVIVGLVLNVFKL